jgi:hypothetical protein
LRASCLVAAPFAALRSPSIEASPRPPDDVHALRDDAARRPGGSDAFDIAVGGRAPAADRQAERAYLTALRDAGATWWHEYLEPDTPLADVRAHIAAGPIAPS